jgi:multidrug efflux pump subunit AcrB
MTSENTGTTENEALGRKIGAIEKEVATVKVVIRRASYTRLVILVFALAFVGTSVWMFYSLARDFASRENLALLADQAKIRMEMSYNPALKEFERLKKTAVPVLKEAFTAQVEKDTPKYSAAVDRERETLMKNLESELEKKITAHFEKASEKYRAILREEFPELKDPALLDAMYSSVVDTMYRLVEEYYSDKVRDEIQGLNDKWLEFEMAELPAEGEPPLEQQFLAALLNLAAMKVDDKSAE